jgi:NADH pyrophosphatase NudC (nudix superfamily)
MNELEKFVDAAKTAKGLDFFKYIKYTTQQQEAIDLIMDLYRSNLIDFILTHIKPLVEGVKPNVTFGNMGLCGKCNKTIYKYHNFCPSCGTKIAWKEGEKDAVQKG